MNILFLDQFSDMGGAQQCLLDLAAGVQEHGWNAHCGLPGEGALVSQLRAMGATTSQIDCGPYESGHKSIADAIRFACQQPRLASQIASLAEQSNADLIYVNGPRVLPAAARAARGRWPLIFHCHSRLSRRYAVELAVRAAERADGEVIACCRFVAEPFVDRIAPGRLHVVPNGVAARKFRRREPPPWRIGIIGRIAAENGQAEFLRAARWLARRREDLRFVVCGAPLFSNRAAHDYADSLPRLADGLPVDFLGWRADAAAVVANLDVLVVPSIGQPGTPRVISEAQAAGVPVVAFAAGGIPEMIVDGKTGFLVAPGAVDILGRRLHELLLQPGRLREVGHAGQTAWREQFTVDRYSSRIIALMQRWAPAHHFRQASPRRGQPPAA